jgi:nitrite reductase/ring-hydroxylating ferredoxin subunit
MEAIMLHKAVSKHEIKGDLWGGMVNGIYVVIYLLADGSVVASEGYCTHDKCMLNHGYIDGEEIECACHGARFHIRSGEVTAPPAEAPLWIFAVEVQGDDIYIDV